MKSRIANAPAFLLVLKSCGVKILNPYIWPSPVLRPAQITRNSSSYQIVSRLKQGMSTAPPLGKRESGIRVALPIYHVPSLQGAERSGRNRVSNGTAKTEIVQLAFDFD